MIDCAYCDHPLICEACGAPYLPPSPELYEALSQPDVSVDCIECGVILVCHWCKFQYDGLAGQEDEGSDAPGS